MAYAQGGVRGDFMKSVYCETSGKKKSTQKQARKEAKFLKYHKKYASLVPQAYKCNDCHWWHVGNSE